MVLTVGPRLRSRQGWRWAPPRCAQLTALTRPHPLTLVIHAVDAQHRPCSRSYEAVEKLDGTVLRCSQEGGSSER